MTETRKGEARERLQAVLDGYGSDPKRWPAGDRQRLAYWLATGEPAMTEALDEARAIDSVLAGASQPVLPAGAVERLLANAEETGSATGAPGNVVALSGVPAKHSTHRIASRPGRLTALTALAASLALGLYLGATGLAEDFMPALLTGDHGAEGLSAEIDMLEGTLQPFQDQVEL